MAVPKRRKSKSATRQNRNAPAKLKKPVQSVKTKDGKAYKRPHIEERIEL